MKHEIPKLKHIQIKIDDKQITIINYDLFLKVIKMIINKVAEKMEIDIGYNYDVSYCKLNVWKIQVTKKITYIDRVFGMFYKKQHAEDFIELLKKQKPTLFFEFSVQYKELYIYNWVTLLNFMRGQAKKYNIQLFDKHLNDLDTPELLVKFAEDNEIYF